MKVVHYGNFCPHSAGMCHTIMDMILAERTVGMDSQLIDWGGPKQYEQDISRVGLTYHGITSVSPDCGTRADIVVHHSGLPQEAKLSGKPVILAMHGRPEYTFELERLQNTKCFGVYRQAAEDPQIVSGISFWKEHIPIWQRLYPDWVIDYVPAMVDLDTYNPVGPMYDLGDAHPNIIVADMWRPDVTPFNVILAAVEFIKKHGGKMHVFGVSQPEKVPAYGNFLTPLKREGYIAAVHGLINYMDKIYRSADFVITPHVIATRVVREALASGCPVVAGSGNSYTRYQANALDVQAFEKEMLRCWEDIQANDLRADARALAEREFNLQNAGESTKAIYERTLKGKTEFSVPVKGDIHRFTPKIKGDIFNFTPYATNGDLGYAMNGYIQAIGDDDWACFMDHDAMWTTSNWYEQLHNIVAENPDYECFSVMTNRLGNPEQIVPGLKDTHDMLYHRKVGREIQARLGTQIKTDLNHTISGVVILVSKNAWQKAGGFMSGFLGVDNNFHQRLVDAGIKVALMKGVYVYHAYRAGQEVFRVTKGE